MPITLSPTDVQKAIVRSTELLAPHRMARDYARREFLGSVYGQGSDDNKSLLRPMNLINFTASTMLPLLAQRNPKHTVVAQHTSMIGEAAILKLVLDQLAADMGLIDTSRICLLDAFLSPYAVVKVGIRAGGDILTVRGRHYDLGRPYIQHVQFEDYFFDPLARSQHEIMWEAQRYRVPRQLALDSGLFNPELIEKLPALGAQPSELDQPGSEDDRNPDNPSVDTESRAELIEMIELVDVAFYDEDTTLLATLPSEGAYAKDYLRISEYEGPEKGPFERLEFCPVPGTAIGLSPAAAMMEQHEALARITRKIVAQIERSKRIFAGRKSSETDLKTAKEAEDGEVVTVDDPNSVATLDFGGISPEVMQGFEALYSMAQQAAGLPDMLAGKSSKDKTATEYQGQMAQAGSRVQDMGATFQAFHDRLARHMGFYVTTDPLIQFGTTHRLPSGEYLHVTYDAATRKGGFPDFAFQIQHQSMGALDPAVQSKRMVELMAVVMQGAQAAMASGGLIDPIAVARVAAKQPGGEGLEEIVKDPLLMQAVMKRMQAMPPGVPGQVTGQAGQQGAGRNQFALGGGGGMGKPDNARPVDAARGAREFAGGVA